MQTDDFMDRAIALSREALTTPGAQPFGAVVVKDGVIVGEGLNCAMARHDPTSHGEIEAIRDACRRLGSVDLSGCELYSSCEPCPMCVAALTVAGIGRLTYAATLAEAGAALAGVPAERRRPVDVDAVRREAGRGMAERGIPARQHRAAEAVAILADWAGR